MRTVTFDEVNPQLLAQLSESCAQPVEAVADSRSVVLLPAAQYERLQAGARERFFAAWKELSDTAEKNGLTQEILDEILAEIDAEPR